MSTLANQPAFPCEAHTDDFRKTSPSLKIYPGITLHQLYAGLALQGILANPSNSGPIAATMQKQFGEGWRAALASGEATALIDHLEKTNTPAS